MFENKLEELGIEHKMYKATYNQNKMEKWKEVIEKIKKDFIIIKYFAV